MKVIDNYEHFAHKKYKLRYHIIFSTKYRKNCLLGSIADDVRLSMERAALGQDWSIEIQEIDPSKPNHIHLLIRSTPNIAIEEIVKRLKQFSTYDIWQKYNQQMKLYYWSGKHYLWTRGYFVTTIGDACTQTIFNYIKNQG